MEANKYFNCSRIEKLEKDELQMLRQSREKYRSVLNKLAVLNEHLRHDKVEHNKIFKNFKALKQIDLFKYNLAKGTLKAIELEFDR